MFGKSKDEAIEDRGSATIPQVQRSPVVQTAPAAPQASSTISASASFIGKFTSDGTVNVLGRVEGELRASTVVIADGAHVEGDLIAEELTIGGRVKGTIHANRVKLTSTAIVEGDIFHRLLAIEENARFEGSSQREDSAIDAAHGQTDRSEPLPAFKWKRNGEQNGEAQANSLTE